MNFEEKLAIGRLVLEYAKVVFGYPVTIPVLVGFLCWLFRERIGAAIDAVRALSFRGASVELAERAAMVEYKANVERTTAGMAQTTTQSLAPKLMTAAMVEALVSFFGLAARLLPLIPKAERQRFIAESMGTLPEEFKTFRAALVKLADEAPEVHALTTNEVLGMGLGESARVAVIPTARHLARTQASPAIPGVRVRLSPLPPSSRHGRDCSCNSAILRPWRPPRAGAAIP
jgi:hypothetical protein